MRVNLPNLSHIFALRQSGTIALICVASVLALSFKCPAGQSVATVYMRLNKVQDSAFQTFESFEANDSLVFSDPANSKLYRLVDYELRLLARPKEMFHNVLRTQKLPMSDIRRYYQNAENTVTVFFSDIRIQSLKDNHYTHAKSFSVKLVKPKKK